MWQEIRKVRNRSGFTQQQVADFCNIKRSAVSQWEASDEDKRTKPSNENFCKFLILTRARPEELIDYDLLPSAATNARDHKMYPALDLIVAAYRDGRLKEISVDVLWASAKQMIRGTASRKKPSQPGERVGERDFTKQDTEVNLGGSRGR